MDSISDFTNTSLMFLSTIGTFDSTKQAIEIVITNYPSLKEEFDKKTLFSKIFKIECCKILGKHL